MNEQRPRREECDRVVKSAERFVKDADRFA